VRLLVERWGVLSRVLLAREAPLLRWAPLFRALRLMELSGELVCGLFFDGLGGPQFTSPEVLARLRRPLPREAVYWLNATDPAALCGLGLPLDLPERRATTWLVYEGARLVLVVRRRGRELEFRVPPDAPRLDAYLGVLEALQQRPVETLRGICVEEINGVAAHASEYRPALAARFQLMTGAGHLKLWRR
jgi:ATP-dependent Lhr-like helicase